MLEDAQLKKPPENHKVNTVGTRETIVHPYGPNVQTVETNSQNREEGSKIFIQDKSTSIPGPMKDYRFLTDGEHIVKMKEEQSKGIDPCEEGMECKQDKEIRKEAKAKEELNWKHKELIPEADGPTITPDRNWNPKGPQDLEQIKEDPKFRAQEGEKEKNEVKEQKKQLQPLEAKDTPYDPEVHFKQRPKETGHNPINIVRTI